MKLKAMMDMHGCFRREKGSLFVSGSDAANIRFEEQFFVLCPSWHVVGPRKTLAFDRSRADFQQE